MDSALANKLIYSMVVYAFYVQWVGFIYYGILCDTFVFIFQLAIFFMLVWVALLVCSMCKRILLNLWYILC